jgi:hypothetical protein
VKRKPDLIIGPASNPYLMRWHVLRLFGYQLSIHKTVRDDDDRALHDHSGWNISVILRGGYLEWFTPPGASPVNCIWRGVGSIVFRRATTPHRLTLSRHIHDGVPVAAWSLWLRGPPTREWGFHCPKGWRHWKEYCLVPDYSKPGATSEIGKGCD